MTKDNLILFEGKYYTKEIYDEIIYADAMVEQYDLLQLTKKITLNSFYGALLSTGFRWAVEERMGASTTYTGRAITTFMLDTTAELLTGVNAGIKKTFELVKSNGEYRIHNIYTADNEAIIYGDTDSGYFKTFAEDIEEAVEIADAVGGALNAAFVGFMQKAFLCQKGYDELIKAGREIVAERALFQARKKYIAKVVDLEGFRVNKLKAMGSEIKKSDTPKIIQKFLKNVLDRILDGLSYLKIAEYVNQQRQEMFRDQISASDIILIGTSKSANNLDTFNLAYAAELEGKPFVAKPDAKGNYRAAKPGERKLTIPGHCRAAINYNVLLEHYEDNISSRINNGDKVKVFQLKKNDHGYPTIAFPAEISKFPKWFLENFEIDLKLSEDKLISAKLEGIFASMGQEVPTPQLSRVTSIVEF